MNDCAIYFDLISAYNDGELQGSDRRKLEEHLAVCPSCSSLLSTCRLISGAVSDSCGDAPEILRDRVMSEILNSSEAEIIKRKNRQIPRLVLMRYVPIAACLAILILALPYLPGLNKLNSAPTTPGGMGGGISGIDSYVYDDIGQSESAAQIPGDIPPPAATGRNESEDENQRLSEPASIPQPENGTVSDNLFSVAEPHDTEPDYYAEIIIKGELPEILAGFDRIDVGGGKFYIYITREIADILIDEGFAADMINENAENALVSYFSS